MSPVRARPRAPNSTTPPPSDLVACLDGPLAGHWFTAADWTARTEAATYMHTRHRLPGARLPPTLAYRPGLRDGSHRIAHPSITGAYGRPLRYRPAAPLALKETA